MDALAEKYADQNIEFLVGYVKEPHAGQWEFKEVVQPAEYEERVELAKQMLADVGLKRQVMIDSLDNKLYLDYGGCPNSVHIIGPEGKIVYHNRWSDHADVAEFLATIV